MAGLSTIFSLILTRIATVSDSRSDEAIGQPPLIYEGPPSDTRTYLVGNRDILPCRAHGTPPIRYDWYQNGQLLGTSTDPESNFFVLDGTLHLKTRSSLTDGYYQCLAVNDFGVDMSNISHLRQAVFQDRQARRVVHYLTVSEGRPLVLRCNHVTSIPPPTVRWYTTEMKSRDPHALHPVHANERITMDESGDLVITAVRKADARDDLVYKCEAYNYITRQTNRGDFYRIRVREEPYETNYAPELIYASTKVTSHIGTNVTLTCIFSGRPTPKMSWRRREGSLDPLSTVMVDSNRSLVLTNVSFDDEGLYICSAANDIEMTHLSINLSIVASPRLVVSPQNRNVTEGNSVSFSCKADARPPPHVAWFRNSRPINLSSSVHLWAPQNDTLTLSGLQLEDSSTVTCNVSNDFGYVLSSAYFVVLPSEATTASLFETSTNADGDAPVVMATVISLDDDVGVGSFTDDTDQYENRDLELPRVNNGENGDGREAEKDRWLDSTPVKCFWFSIPVLLLIGFGFLVWQRYRNRKTTYRVDEQEKKHGSNNVDYDSEDSGYDEQKADRVVKKFKILEKEPT